VPGSLVRSDGSLGGVVEERVEAAVALYRAGVVGKVLMSGDNGSIGYDEPGAMRDAALAAGVAADDVFTDYAGFSTWRTMDRAVRVFGVRTAVVVTQGLYAARSVDLARAAGIDAQVLAVGGDGGLVAREVLARVRGLVEATFRPPATGGPPIPIEGDGRTSWA
jgi:SanA protein